MYIYILNASNEVAYYLCFHYLVDKVYGKKRRDLFKPMSSRLLDLYFHHLI